MLTIPNGEVSGVAHGQNFVFTQRTVALMFIMLGNPFFWIIFLFCFESY